jgi:hypothetical protein
MFEAMSLMSYLFPVCFGGTFLLVGGILAFIANNQRKQSRLARGWPTVTGSVLSTGLSESTNTTTDANGMMSTSTSYVPVVEYLYEVNGQSFQNNRVFPGRVLGFGRRAAARVIANYSPGMNTAVYYDPANPAESVLETEAKGSNLLWYMGLGFLTLGFLSLCGGSALVFVFSSALGQMLGG